MTFHEGENKVHRYKSFDSVISPPAAPVHVNRQGVIENVGADGELRVDGAGDLEAQRALPPRRPRQTRSSSLNTLPGSCDDDSEDSCICKDEFILFCMLVTAIVVVGLMLIWWGFFGV